MCLLLSILLLLVRVCLSASSDEGPSQKKTSNAILPSPDTVPDASGNLYSAVNVTLFPTRSSALGYYRFIPASFWIDSESPNRSVHSLIVKNLSVPSEDNLAHLPDLSFWKDNSVLLLSIHQMDFSGHAPAKCPRLRICGVPHGTPLQKEALEYTDDESGCHRGLGEISASCYDRMSSASHHIFPLTFGLSVSVTSLGDRPDEYNSTLKFVASAGYRLPPETYQCPAGLFPCPVPSEISEPRSPNITYQYRICLPRGLWCDGVINCPDDGSDEKYCNPGQEPENTAFKKVDSEEGLLQKHLANYSHEYLYQAGYPRVTHSASVQLLILIVVGALLFLMAVVGSLILVRRKRRNFSRPQRERGFANSLLDSEKKESLIPSGGVPENDRSKRTNDSQPDIAVR